MRRLAMLTGAVLAAAWVLAPTPVRAADFYLLFEKSKLLVGYLVQSDESLKVFDGDKTLLRCTRTSQKIRCRFEFADAPAAWDDYTVHIENPPLLIFTNPLATDYYVVDVVTRSAVLTSRALDHTPGKPTRYSGAKVCQGMYLTESERRLLEALADAEVEGVDPAARAPPGGSPRRRRSAGACSGTRASRRRQSPHRMRSAEPLVTTTSRGSFGLSYAGERMPGRGADVRSVRRMLSPPKPGGASIAAESGDSLTDPEPGC